MSWQVTALLMLAVVVVGGFVWYERSRPPARIVAAVGALAALGVAGRIVLAPIPNVVATTDVALLAGYTLGGGPGFAVGALSGLVSNFWLGQGPWTPWQMAGWGLVGLGGAMLAATRGRRLGRWGLAGVAAFAGLAYGALLDLSVMVNYGGEQSLDRYLALSVRGIPFNIAHALGNAALMLAAGPAMVRMLDRYRDRFEVRWSDAPLPRAAVALAAAMCLVLPLLGPHGADAADEDPAKDDLAATSLARGWLSSAQNDDGGFGISAESKSSPGMTGWAMLGLEAAGLNPRDVAVDGVSPVQYLRKHASQVESTGDLERTILALEGARVDSRRFAGEDLVARLRDRQSKDGSFEHQVNLTAFAILAQRSAGVRGGNVGEPAQWLRSVQNRNGGWGSIEGAESEPDSTGAALQALSVAPGKGGPIEDGARWLERSQRGDGGWSLTPGATPNSQSTAWAIQGLAAAERDPAAIKNDGRSGIDYLERRQAGDGHYRYSRDSDQTPVWVTAQGVTGAAAAPFPLKPATLAVDAVSGGASGGAADAPADLEAAVDAASGGAASSTPADPFDFPGSPSAAGSPGGGGDGGVPGGGGPSGTAPDGGAGPGDVPPESEAALGFGDTGSAIAAPTTEAAPVAFVASNREGSSLPSTPVMLSTLVVLAIGLAAGFLWYRRRLP